MAETFYSILGVDPDTDEGTIREAYRSAVKTHHPDVSDDPNASRRFKRLTTARDVLLDESERARYDRLGHDTYVETHLSGATWRESPTDPGVERDVTADRSAAETPSHDTGDVGTPDQSARSPRDEPWQSASASYRRSSTASAAAATRSRGRSIGRVIRSIGPWLTVHLVLLLSAGATAWFTVAQMDQAFSLSLPGYLVGFGLFGIVLLGSVLHLMSVAYA